METRPAIMEHMFGDESGESFEETLRSIAAALGRYIERSFDNVDAEEFADFTGVDAATAREWAESAARWVSDQTQNLGERLAREVQGRGRSVVRVDPLGGAAAHPLDLASDEQGLALAALDSGRWMIEPGTDALAAKGEGPGPSDALGIVRELRVRDWIAGDGRLTLTGQHALRRWLDATAAN